MSSGRKHDTSPDAASAVSAPPPPPAAATTRSSRSLETPAPPKPPDTPLPALTHSSTTGGIGVSLARTASWASFHRPSVTSKHIDDILEAARERAETMGTGTATGRAPGSPVPGRRPSDSVAFSIPEDHSADETTGIVSRGSDVNYQAIQSTNTHTSGPRARKVPSRNSNGSSKPGDNRQPASVPDMDYARQAGHEDKGPPWWKTQLDKFQSIELENKGSVARDHLAIERTFLAWLRTSLAFASIGIAVTQLFRLNTSLEADRPSKNLSTLRQMGKPLGSTFLGISILILFLGYKRYFLAQQWVMQGKFPASRGTVTIVAFVAFAIMVASLVVVIAIHPAEIEL